MASSCGEEENFPIPIDDDSNQVIEVDNFEKISEEHANQEIQAVVHQVEGEFQLKHGMIVHDEKEAYDLYNEYGLQKGFSICCDQKRYKFGTKELRERTYVCSKEGFRDSNPFEVKKVDRLETRTGCMAYVTFKVENGLWEISRFSDEHNHEMALPEQKHLLRSARKMSNTTKDVIHSLHSVGVGPTKAHNFIAKEAGGFQNFCGTNRDFHNFVNQERINLMEAGDAQSLINHFKRKQAENPMFFYSMQLDDKNRLTNVFWRDGISKLDYDSFGDVVIFDTTFRTNRYNMVCAPFVGINHHWQNILFGCAFLLDETISSFVWLFESFLESMGNKHPKVIFTDQDHAMANAIKQVFPDARHRLCEWHIHKNAAQNIPHLYGKPEFRKLFYKCFRGCETEDEFEAIWKEMVTEWDAVENSWLRKLYDVRMKWCPVFSSDFFSANMKSTQRSESTNNVFHHMSSKMLALTEFFEHYEDNALKMREAERNEDFRCANGRPRVSIPSDILIQAAGLYTTKMFAKFQEEFNKGVAQKVIKHVRDGEIDFYKVNMKSSSMVHTVRFDTRNLTIDCSCKKFESLGLLCSHTLRILQVSNDVSNIPEKYISKRWTKGAKDLGVVGQCISSDKKDVKESKTITFSRLMHKSSKVINFACFDERAAGIFEKLIDEAYEKIKKYKDSLGDGSTDTNCDQGDTDQIHSSVGKKSVFDPPRVKPKGAKNKRMKSFMEKPGKKKTKRPQKQKPNATSSGFNIGPIDLNVELNSFGVPVNTSVENQFQGF